MSDVSLNGLNDKWFRLIGNPLSVLLFKLAQLPLFTTDKWTFLWKSVISLAATIISWEIARLIIIRARKKYPGLSETKQRIGFFAMWIAAEMLILQLILTQLLFSTGLAATYAYSFEVFWLANACIGFLVFAFIGGIYEAMYFFHQYKSAIQKTEHLKKQHAQQQLDALKNRVNPHFLFNSLTTLSALIGEDAPRAERFLDELSKVYRHLLRAGRQPTMALEEELAFAKSYAFLMENRFGQGEFSLSFQIDSSVGFKPTEESDILLPALSLQNAIDYLVRTQNLPLHIDLKVIDNALHLVCDDRPKTRAFNASDADWQHLENHGALLSQNAGQLVIDIPFSQYPLQ